MTVPLAAMRLVVLVFARSELEAGKTDSSAPESMRKSRFDKTSMIEIEEEGEREGRGKPAAAISDRPWSFPASSGPDGASDTAWTYRSTPWGRISHE